MQSSGNSLKFAEKYFYVFADCFDWRRSVMHQKYANEAQSLPNLFAFELC